MIDRAAELERIRLNAESETRDFATIQAMARAKARNEPYNPEVHGPHDAKIKPPRERYEATKPSLAKLDENLAAIIERFSTKAPPQLSIVPSAKPSLPTRELPEWVHR